MSAAAAVVPSALLLQKPPEEQLHHSKCFEAVTIERAARWTGCFREFVYESDVRIMEKVLKVGIKGGDMGSLGAVIRLLMLMGKDVLIKLFLRGTHIGGIVSTDEKRGDDGPLFNFKAQQNALLNAVIFCVGGVQNLHTVLDIDPDWRPDADSGKSPQGTAARDALKLALQTPLVVENCSVMHIGADGVALDSDKSNTVEAALNFLRGFFIPAIVEEADLANINLSALTPLQAALDKYSAGQWLRGEVPELAAYAIPEQAKPGIQAFIWQMQHDNGFNIDQLNLLWLLMMFCADGAGYWNLKSLWVKGGGSTLTKLFMKTALDSGCVEVVENCPVELREADQPILYEADGTAHEFDMVFVGTTPATYEACLKRNEPRRGKAIFRHCPAGSFMDGVAQDEGYGPDFEWWKHFSNDGWISIFFGGDAYEKFGPNIPAEVVDRAIPGIKAHLGDAGYRDMVNDPELMSAFGFIGPNAIATVVEIINMARGGKVACVCADLSHKYPAYPAGAFDVAFTAVEAMLEAWRKAKA